jgi:DUF4097 and DUF4098 domain-containing protein YvlB
VASDSVDAPRLYYIKCGKSMGKRELLLVLGFAVVGTLVYQLTARPSAESSSHFSVGAVVDHLRRAVRGNQAHAEVVTTDDHPMSPATTEVRVVFPNGNAESLTITGEDRKDVASELKVWSNGFDEAEAQRLAKGTVLKPSEAGGRMTFTLTFPREARQRANIVLRVPNSMRVGVVRYAGSLTVTGTKEVEIVDSRGEAVIRDISGRVTVSHRSGELTLGDLGALKLTTNGTDVKLSRIRGDTTIQTRGGDLVGSELEGAVDIESSNADITLEHLESSKAPIHVNATNGSVRIRGARTDTRVDSRNADVVLEVAQAAPIAVYSEGNESIELTAPRGGFLLDAVSTAGGQITAPAAWPGVKTEGSEQHAKGAVNGGGPTITLRSTQGEIVVRSADDPRPAEAPAPPHPPRPPVPPKLERRLEGR